MLGRIKYSWAISFRTYGLEVEMAAEKLEVPYVSYQDLIKLQQNMFR